MKHHLILPLLLAFCCVSVIAEPVCRVTLYDENSGLAQQHVTQILQDRRGMMWFSTWNGINRFDGYDFECFKSRPGDGCMMPTDRIRNIVINSTGDIWCLVDDRIFLFDIAQYKFFDISTPLDHRLKHRLSFISMTAAAYGRSWLRCKDGLTLIVDDRNPVGGNVVCIYSKGHKPVIAKSTIPKRTWPLTDNRVICIKRRTGDISMLRRNNALFVSQSAPAVWKEIAKLPTADIGQSSYLHEDESGTIWLITPDGKLYNYDDVAKILHEYPMEGPKISDINGFYEDRQHNLWLRSKNGVYKLSFSLQPATPMPQQKPAQIRCLFSDNGHRYWVTSKEDATVRIYTSDNRLMGYLCGDGTLSSSYVPFGASVYCIAQQRDGTLWLGSKPDGLFRLTSLPGGGYRVKQFKHDAGNNRSISSDGIYDIKEDMYGRLWIATLGGGINCIADTRADAPIFYHCGNLLRGHYPAGRSMKVRAIHITRNHILLAATTEGLLVADIRYSDLRKIAFNRHCREANREQSLSNDATMNILEDHKHRIFVCTESGGVNEVVSANLLSKSLDFRQFTTNNGLTTDVVLSMFEHSNRIWLVGDNQLMRLDPDHGRVENFDIHFWKVSYRFSDAIPIQLPDGRWLFGHFNGAFTVTPAQLVKGTYVPPIALTGLTIQNRENHLAVDALDTILIHPDERNITIHFAALDYTNTPQISYAFRLMEKGVQWSYIRKGHSATFLDMQPGTYTLEIRSTNSDGQWVNNIRRVTVIVEPAFWETGWAKALYILFVLGILFATLYLVSYIRGIKRQRKEILDSYLALLKEKPSESPHLDQAKTQKPQLSAEDDAFMKRILAFVDDNISNTEVSIEDMASASATSRSGLNRKMKSIVGMTPIDFLNEARIQKSCKLLKEGELHISEIAFQCGFSDPKYFSRAFKKATDMTPSEYRDHV